MLSTEDLERLITTKRREIEEEKTILGLTAVNNDVEDLKTCEPEKKVSFRSRAFSESNVLQNPTSYEEDISPNLERYIRRYIGLPGMLKAGEYSPNNPLTREERSGGDVLRALGEYERRRHTLRKIRQRQYKEYLDQQAKKKQEAKEQAEREQREREEKERIREEKERERLEFREKSPERRRLSVNVLSNENYINKVDTAVQVDHTSTPLSVAVQTDGRDIILSRNITQAERELSPRNVGEFCTGRRRSYGDYDDRNRVTSIFDEDTVRMRNIQAEKEALERRQYYQQELRNQILEQQRIREERKSREKMLEQAEMRRLEEQLRSLKMAQEREIQKQRDKHTAMTDSALDYEKKRTDLQKEIDYEKELVKIHRNRNTRSESPNVRDHRDHEPYCTNITDNTIYTHDYDLENCLRRNLNPYKDTGNKRTDRSNRDYGIDTLPIPVLRHSPKITADVKENTQLSEKMKIVDDKWKVPAVQKNILKSLHEKGKNVSILTQLGSIRRQLQLEQLKLDELAEA